MKRILSIVLMLVIITGTAFAEWDLNSMSREELTDLYHQISLLLFGQKLTEGVQIYEGNYTVGKDLPAGRYLLRAEGFQEDQDENYNFAFIEAYNAEGRKISGAVGRMTYGNPVLLVDIPEDTDYVRIGTSSQAKGVKITIQIAESLWTAP